MKCVCVHVCVYMCVVCVSDREISAAQYKDKSLWDSALEQLLWDLDCLNSKVRSSVIKPGWKQFGYR